MLFPRLVDNFKVILSLKNDLIDGGDYSFAMIQSHPHRYDQVFVFRIISFFLPKTSKQVFHCRTQDTQFTGNSKVVDREMA